MKSSLEAKISNLSEQLREIKNYQSFAPRGGALDDVTNKKFETIQEIQNQQIQFQNYMMTQLSQLSADRSADYFRAPPPEPRKEVPEPTPPNSHRPVNPVQQPKYIAHPVTNKVVRHEPEPPRTIVKHQEFGVDTLDMDDRTMEKRVVGRDEREMNLDWLDEVAPLPVRPSSPVNIGPTRSPIKIIFEEKKSQFENLSQKLDDVMTKRKQFESNYKKQTSNRKEISEGILDPDSNEEIKKKVEKAIQDAIKNPSKVQRTTSKTSKSAVAARKAQSEVRTKTGTRTSKTRVRSPTRTKMVSATDDRLRELYGRAPWETSPKKVRNPYVHVNSPQKPVEKMRKLTNVTFDQAKSVRSKKQQTTPRLSSSAVPQSKPVGAIQIAPPVRAGPSSKTYRPPPVLTSSSASELATSTPRSITQSKSLSEALEISKIPIDHEVAPVSREPSIKEPLDKPIEVVGDAFDRQKLTGKHPVANEKKTKSHFSEPPLIIKPSYEIPVINQGVSEERLDDRLGELKNWIESELLHKLIEGKKRQRFHDFGL